MTDFSPRYDRPPVSLISTGIGPDGVSLFIGDTDGARDLALLEAKGITTVVNCAVNLDLNYVQTPSKPASAEQCAAGSGPVRYYKIGLIDGPGNPASMLMAGYYILDGALRQIMPDKPSYPHKKRGNVLVNCRGGRSRSVALGAVYLHCQQPELHPTLDHALDHVRIKRELRPDEWFETPKPTLVEAARQAVEAIKSLERTASHQRSLEEPGCGAAP